MDGTSVLVDVTPALSRDNGLTLAGEPALAIAMQTSVSWVTRHRDRTTVSVAATGGNTLLAPLVLGAAAVVRKALTSVLDNLGSKDAALVTGYSLVVADSLPLPMAAAAGAVGVMAD
jgi:hypothetical protein